MKLYEAVNKLSNVTGVRYTNTETIINRRQYAKYCLGCTLVGFAIGVIAGGISQLINRREELEESSDTCDEAE